MKGCSREISSDLVRVVAHVGIAIQLDHILLRLLVVHILQLDLVRLNRSSVGLGIDHMSRRSLERDCLFSGRFILVELLGILDLLLLGIDLDVDGLARFSACFHRIRERVLWQLKRLLLAAKEQVDSSDEQVDDCRDDNEDLLGAANLNHKAGHKNHEDAKAHLVVNEVEIGAQVHRPLVVSTVAIERKHTNEQDHNADHVVYGDEEEENIEAFSAETVRKSLDGSIEEVNGRNDVSDEQHFLSTVHLNSGCDLFGEAFGLLSILLV